MCKIKFLIKQYMTYYKIRYKIYNTKKAAHNFDIFFCPLDDACVTIFFYYIHFLLCKIYIFSAISNKTLTATPPITITKIGATPKRVTSTLLFVFEFSISRFCACCLKCCNIPLSKNRFRLET